jgi:adenosylmethionine-8-amino-7-oxononanoate aminotransferase
MSLPDLLAADQRHVWHPYSACPAPLPAVPVARAAGTRLMLEDGRELIDGMSSWWAAIHGYAHPRLDRALSDQLERMAHVMFGGLTHRPAVALCERLVALAPGHDRGDRARLDKVFLCDSGSVAVEVALKMALQYWHGRGQPERRRMLTVRGGYHGDTLGAMSICDPVTGMHRLFAGVVPSQLFAEAPPAGFDRSWDDSQVAGLAELLERHQSEIAAVVLEPIVQGAGGMRFHSPAYLGAVRRLCDEYRVLLVLDEIATGFGRTGALFASDHAGVVPDILCLGKALTGGYMTLAAVLTSQPVAGHICRGEPGQFMHGPTFMGNPLACAVALASIELLLESDWRARVAALHRQLTAELGPCRHLPGVRDVRVLGAIGVVEMERPVDLPRAQALLIERGVWLRPFGRLLYTMPPYITTPPELSRITAAMRDVAAALGG